MRPRKNDKPQESRMKLVLHATEPATRDSTAAQLIEHDLVTAAQFIEHNVVELIARIEALRVPAATRATKLSAGPLELDLIERTAKRGDRSIDLLPREFRLIEYMMRRKGRIPSRETLLREVWKYKFVPETNLVDVHMGRLRRKIDGPYEPPMIRNVRGQGFIFSIEDGQPALPHPTRRVAAVTQDCSDESGGAT
jgi:DNA-binding winged helix-turn-helix (wHTH) protein